jgi:hypothetical protein
MQQFNRDELIALRSTKPEYTERRTTDSIPIPPVAEDPSPSRIVDLSDTVPSKTKDSEALATTTATTTTNSSPVDHMDDENTNGAATNTATDTIDLATATETADADNNNNDDDDSNEQVVSDETAQIDQDLLTEEENGEDDDFDDDDDFDGGPMPPIVSLVMQQILTVEAASGQVAIHVVTDSGKQHPMCIIPSIDQRHTHPYTVAALIVGNGTCLLVLLVVVNHMLLIVVVVVVVFIAGFSFSFPRRVMVTLTTLVCFAFFALLHVIRNSSTNRSHHPARCTSSRTTKNYCIYYTKWTTGTCR